MTFIRDIRVIKNLAFHTRTPLNHKNQMELFYQNQSGDYDFFRKKLLPNRNELIHSLLIQKGDRVLDVGGGTGFLMDVLGKEKIRSLDRLDIIDLSASLLKIGKNKAFQHQYQNVFFYEKDFNEFHTTDSYDIILFSYSLSMICHWEKALSKAYLLSRKGGKIGVVDFYISPLQECKEWTFEQHPRWMRFFWPKWFQVDHVFLSPQHLIALEKQWSKLKLKEMYLSLPYIPFLKVPSYQFIGRKE